MKVELERGGGSFASTFIRVAGSENVNTGEGRGNGSQISEALRSYWEAMYNSFRLLAYIMCQTTPKKNLIQRIPAAF